MKESRAEFVDVRGLRHHIRRWGEAPAPTLYILHGLLDVSASFQLVVDAFKREWNIVAPDWRGCGLTEWPQDGYWFPDYIADLDVIVQHYSGDAPALFAGHSMGGQVASMYAGVRPERVGKLVILDSLGIPELSADTMPKRYRKWLAELADPPTNKIYVTFEELAERVRFRHPKLTPERADFVARCWGRETAPGRIELLGDPKHRLRMPNIYRVAESIALWKEIAAEVLFVDAGESFFGKLLPPEEKNRRREAFRKFRTEVVPGASHMLHHDHPEETAGVVESFLINQSMGNALPS